MTSTPMELRLFLLLVLLVALASSLPATHLRERRTSNPVLRDKAREAIKTKQFRYGSRYGRAWQPPVEENDNVYGLEDGDAFKYQLMRNPLLQKLLEEWVAEQQSGGY